MIIPQDDIMHRPLGEVVTTLLGCLDQADDGPADGGIMEFDTQVAVVFWRGHPRLTIGDVHDVEDTSKSILEIGARGEAAFTVRAPGMTFWVATPRLAKAIHFLASFI